MQPGVARLSGDLDNAAMRIMLIDDRPVAGIGLSAILGAQPDLDVVRTEREVGAALDVLSELEPDVVVLDTETADSGTFAAIRAVVGQRPQSAVLLISDDRSADTALLALAAGTSGYLSSRAEAELMVQAVRTIGVRGLVLPRSAAAAVTGRSVPAQEPAPDRMPALSSQERRVLGMLADGRSNNEIARVLFVSEATVKKHLSQVLRKLGVRDRLQAGLYAYRVGLGTVEEPPFAGGSGNGSRRP